MKCIPKKELYKAEFVSPKYRWVEISESALEEVQGSFTFSPDFSTGLPVQDYTNVLDSVLELTL